PVMGAVAATAFLGEKQETARCGVEVALARQAFGVHGGGTVDTAGNAAGRTGSQQQGQNDDQDSRGLGKACVRGHEGLGLTGHAPIIARMAPRPISSVGYARAPAHVFRPAAGRSTGQATMSEQQGRLWVVATPIGNLDEDRKSTRRTPVT